MIRNFFNSSGKQLDLSPTDTLDLKKRISENEGRVDKAKEQVMDTADLRQDAVRARKQHVEPLENLLKAQKDTLQKARRRS